jgi:hypothetical protein
MLATSFSEGVIDEINHIPNDEYRDQIGQWVEGSVQIAGESFPSSYLDVRSRPFFSAM